jgi:hypothetical protein
MEKPGFPGRNLEILSVACYWGWVELSGVEWSGVPRPHVIFTAQLFLEFINKGTSNDGDGVLRMRVWHYWPV